jgi:glycosyltransferase involved in cell wall biosynthesis
MRVKIQGFLFGKSHSWAYVNQNLGRGLLKLGHDVEFISTDGVLPEHTPEDLKPYIKQGPSGKYDLQISYTAMMNFPYYLGNGHKNRLGIWCYEFPNMPKDMIKYHNFCDKILPPSNFARDIFVNNKVPEDKLHVVPHGIFIENFQNKEKYKLNTKKQLKFLIPLGQPHIRKAIPKTIETFYKAFTDKDDVCLVAKIPKKSKTKPQPFEIDINSTLNSLNSKYKNHPQVELITSYVPDMVTLYNACDVVYSLTYAECFFMPALEGFAANKLIVLPRHGGQLDFCNDNNSILISGKDVRAGIEAQYWTGSPQNSFFDANEEEAIYKLREVYQNYSSILNSKVHSMNETVKDYTWESAVSKLMEVVK